MAKNIFCRILILFSFFFHSGCFYVDTVAKFHLNGQILDRNSKNPVKNSEVIFIGLLEEESTAYASKIIISESNGDISTDFIWRWGKLQYFYPSSPDLNFIVLILNNEYIIEAKYLRNDELPETEDGYILDLGKIFLRPKDAEEICR